MLTREIPDNYCQRRPINEQESCLICHEDLNANENILTWCKIQCGVNFHRGCVLKWAATKWEDENFFRSGSDIQCGICRQSWVFTGEELLEAIRIGQNGHIYKAIEGYTNVAKILGIKELGMSEEEFQERKLELLQYGDEALASTLRQMSEAESQVYRRHVLEVGGDRLRCVIIQLRRKGEFDAWTEAYIRLHHPTEIDAFRRAMDASHSGASEKWQKLMIEGLLMELMK
ncbi:hypothetical protein OCU04_011475 [Sclerotinia nivalis]|uniref:RING-type domain-containing protein n=1 Tax=Sclerotinia nivalis TaxID=352851 RepID=A0A9X0ABU0_9HELO|nr:hypothetical protein OCU04_011475 [Sclerotinia nivalis]